jgi:ferredoxin
MSVHLVVDTDICIGSGECVGLDPEAVEIQDGFACVLVDPMEEGRAQALCDTCPVGALSIED